MHLKMPASLMLQDGWLKKCIEHVYSLPLVAACPCVHPD